MHLKSIFALTPVLRSFSASAGDKTRDLALFVGILSV